MVVVGMWFSRRLELSVRDAVVTQSPLCALPKWEGRWKIGGKWAPKFVAHTLEAKDSNIFLPKCLRECFSLVNALTTSTRTLECSGILTVISTQELRLYCEGADRKHSVSKSCCCLPLQHPYFLRIPPLISAWPETGGRLRQNV